MQDKPVTVDELARAMFMTAMLHTLSRDQAEDMWDAIVGEGDEPNHFKSRAAAILAEVRRHRESE